MKANVLLAAALVLGATAASADTMKYTFADDNGVPYCDGLQLDNGGGSVASGVHISGSQCTEGDYAGGLQGKYFAGKGKYWFVTTTDSNNLPGVVEAYFLDTKNMTWEVYDEDTVHGSPFQLANSGVLLTGKPPAHFGHQGVSGRKP